MIAVDTSALLAIVLNEPEAEACARALKQAGAAKVQILVLARVVKASEALI